jgi:hypothetical protein
MDSRQKIWLATGLAAAGVAFALLPEATVHAAMPPPDKDVVVVNLPTQPVPVTGSVSVSGSTTVSGSVNSAQAGAWHVGAAQDGAWSVGINPSQNVVKAESPTFLFDSGFNVINDGQTLELGPFDLSKVEKARIIVRGINGHIHAEIRAETGTFDLPLETLEADGESSSSVTRMVVYEAPPPSIYIRLTESGPGGSNYHVMVIGR